MIKIKFNTGTGNYNKLSVFDFDDTLFRCPDAPKGFKGNWKLSKDSLNPPVVPEHPNESFWNKEVVESAKKELTNPNTFCILLTGRVGDIFHERIMQLLKQESLDFPLVKCNEFSGDTVDFKISTIEDILEKYKSIKKIEMWDDDKEKIELYKERFEVEYDFKVNHIS